MNISYDNSMYTAIPPTPIATERFPDEMFTDAVEEHLYEQYEYLSWQDLDELRNCELINNES